MILTGIIEKIKNNRFQLPIWLGTILAKIPFGLRPVVGRVYIKRSKEIRAFPTEQKREIIFNQVYSIVKYAIAQIPFYREFYAAEGFTLDMLNSFDDIKRIPIIDKSILSKYSIEERSNLSLHKFLVNTGGSTGNTLNLYVQPDAIGHEWAHIHNAWSHFGYKNDMLRIMFVGRNKVMNVVDYDFARHALVVDIYKPFPDIALALKKYLVRYPAYFLHGYPSVIADFANYCQQEDPQLLSLLKKNLKAAFLSSEYPYAKYRDVIEFTFNIKTQSFYGHTERCIMAYENECPYQFIPFQTYGYTEAIERGDGHYNLVGTSYYNFATPLIRYNTNDIIDNPIKEDGVLTQFEIYEGREGQYIISKSGQKISLTALIMGRHHDLLDYVNHIQVSQIKDGLVAVLYVTKDSVMQLDALSLFDSSNVDVDFLFYKIDKPIRTVSGKINLLLPSSEIRSLGILVD